MSAGAIRRLVAQLLGIGGGKESRAIRGGVERKRQLEIDAIRIGYPPRAEGVAIEREDIILAAHADILAQTQLELGLADPCLPGANFASLPARMQEYNFDTLVRHVVRNLIGYVHLLPASENHHHAEVGGLIRHSLEVALYATRHSQSQELPAVRHPDERVRKKPRWEYATWISALGHDMGKVFYDMRVYGVSTGIMWNPAIEDIYTWSSRVGEAAYRIEWRQGGRAGIHSSLAAMVFERLLTPATKSYLFDGSDDLQPVMQAALSGVEQRNNLAAAIKKGERRSVGNDMKWQWDRIVGARRTTIEAAFVKTLRVMAKGWHINTPGKGRVWILGDDAFLTFPSAVADVVERMRGDGWDVPAQTNAVLEILAERQIVEPFFEDVLSGHFYEDGRPDQKAERIIKLRWPGIVFENALVPTGTSGRIEADQEGQIGVRYHRDGSIEVFDTRVKSSDRNVEAVSRGRQPSITREPVVTPSVGAQAPQSSGQSAAKPARKPKAAKQEGVAERKSVDSAAAQGGSDPLRGLVFKNGGGTSSGEGLGTMGAGSDSPKAESPKAESPQSCAEPGASMPSDGQGDAGEIAGDECGDDAPGGMACHQEMETEVESAAPDVGVKLTPAAETGIPFVGGGVAVAPEPAAAKEGDESVMRGGKEKPRLMIPMNEPDIEDSAALTTMASPKKLDARGRIELALSDGRLLAEKDFTIQGQFALVRAAVVQEVLGMEPEATAEALRRDGVLGVDPATPRRVTEQVKFADGSQAWCYRLKLKDMFLPFSGGAQKSGQDAGGKGVVAEKVAVPTSDNDKPASGGAAASGKSKKPAKAKSVAGESEELMFAKWMLGADEESGVIFDGDVVLVNQPQALAQYATVRPGAPDLKLKKFLGMAAQQVVERDGVPMVQLGRSSLTNAK